MLELQGYLLTFDDHENVIGTYDNDMSKALALTCDHLRRGRVIHPQVPILPR